MAALLGREFHIAIQATRGGNDFWTDASGDATFRTRLAFPLADVAGGADEAPTLSVRIASHCADHPGRPPESVSRQAWFDWHFVP